MQVYHTKNRKKFLIKLHVVLVTKYRKSLISGSLDSDIKIWCSSICASLNCPVDVVETDKNHIHLLVDLTPELSVSTLIKEIKRQSTYDIWKKYSFFLKQHFWKEKTFWSDGYFVCSTGDASTETIRNYIETQG